MIRALGFTTFLFVLISALCSSLPVRAQTKSATISGTVTDAKQAALPGAQIEVESKSVTAVSDSQGKFTLSGLAPGTYNLVVSYVGFSPISKSVTVAADEVANVNVVLEVASQSEQVLVTATRAHGEAEAINEERTTSNILDVLPAKVITSLPNANVADAVGRLPGVTLERDEGEGKYVQIRGTEPRLSNLTIDGVEVPSPEGGVRQVKLDVIPADLVQSVQIFKTLQANQPGDAIGGSVNIETKSAGERPTLSFFGLGGFTPIINTVGVAETGATLGKRFGSDHRFGVIIGGGYDYNGRGIDDIEPTTGILAGTTFTPDFTSIAIRQYKYDRRRFGFGSDVDYKLSNTSTVFVRTLFSNFEDFGHRWEWVLNTPRSPNGTSLPQFDTERRTGDYQVASLTLGGDHNPGKWYIQWLASVARSRLLTPIGGGESHTIFSFIPATSNCDFNPAATTNPFLPQFNQACFTEAYDPSNFQLQVIQQSAHGLTAQLNLFGSANLGRSYTIGTHQGLLQFGASFRNAHKFDNSFEIDITPSPNAPAILQNSFGNVLTNHNYYGGAYQIGPTTSWEQINQFAAANPGLFVVDPTMQNIPQSGNSNNFDLVERVAAGYVMNTLEFGRFSLIGGVRFEGTQDSTLSFDLTKGTLSFPGNGSYVDVLPSVSLAIKLDNNSDLRLAYARGISRPDPSFLTTATNIDNSTSPPTLTIGNPALKPEHANNYDVLYERYLNPIGLFRAGYFYKSLSTPIVTLLTGPVQVTNPPGNFFVNQANNAGSAYITGIEIGFQQHFSYLPGMLRGLGVLANYSFATSRAYNVNPGNRSDSPALLRQAPHTWNLSPTYDRGRVSVRVGMAYNSANIFSYFFADGAQGGINGPGGDLFLFSHFQVDAQGSYRLGKGWTAIASALNLNNAVFGFYNGSPQFFIQREYYRPTYSFGFRWDSHSE
ncbi:MAG: TonB-dependent receptor [Candidatus Acidiferrales bacterium]